MEFEEHEDQEEEMAYDSVTNSAPRPKMGPTGGEGAPTPPPPTSATTPTTNWRKSGGGIRYRECLKNHAVTIGGHAVDGCGEFMAAGEEGTLDALKCAACNCHRNFHRKEIDERVIGTGEPIFHHHHPQFSPFYRAPPPSGYLHITPPPPPLHHRPLALPAASGGGGYSRDEEDMSNPSSSGGGGGIGGVGSGGGGASGGSSRKRFRTKFSVEQKDKMLVFAEKIGWRIQKHDEVAVEQFCAETGVRRHVLKVWMHNNKHTLGKKP